jgi:hypothetical protein
MQRERRDCARYIDYLTGRTARWVRAALALDLTACVPGSWMWTGAAKGFSAPLGTAAPRPAVFARAPGRRP